MHEPRPFGLELDGYAHLPRLLDKARATLAGTAGRYEFGCPVDHTCMARLGVTPELVLDLARRHTDDREVLEALREHGIPPARDAWFDAVAVEDELNVVLVELAPGRAGDESVAGSAQIWVVQAGAATFFLGRLQARIVRAGEVVRIPAGVPWRVENRGDGVFRAVAVAPAATR